MEKQCHDDETSRDELESSFQRQIEELEQELLKLQQKQIMSAVDGGGYVPQDYTTWLSERIDIAVQQAVDAFWMEDAQRRLQDLEKSLLNQFRDEIATHQRHTQVTIERQRQKMRALVKTMAIRERKLYALEQEHQRRQEEQQQVLQRKSEEKDREEGAKAAAIVAEVDLHENDRRQQQIEEEQSSRPQVAKSSTASDDDNSGGKSSTVARVREYMAKVVGMLSPSKKDHDIYGSNNKTSNDPSATPVAPEPLLMFSPLK
jgi:hypothetical protein